MRDTNNATITRSSIHEMVYYWCLTLTAVSLPFSIKASSAFIIILLVNWISEGNFKTKFRSFKNRLLLLFVLFYLMQIFSTLYSANVKDALFQLEKKLPLIILPLVIGTSIRLSFRQTSRLLRFFIISVSLSSLICLGYATHRNNYWEVFSNPVWFYFSYYDLTQVLNIQPNYLALYVGFSILVIVYFIVKNWNSYSFFKRVLLSVGSFYLFIFLSLLSGRTPILAVIFIMFFGLTYYSIRQAKIFKGILITSVIVFFLLVTLYQFPIIRERLLQTFNIEQNMTWINQYGDGTGGLPQIRLLKWQCSWNVIKDNWLFGVGVGDVQDSLQIQYASINFELALNQGFNSHNQFLQIWIGTGLIGLFIFVLSMILHFLRSFRSHNYVFVMFITFFLICSLTESTLERQWGITFFGLFYSIFAFGSDLSWTKSQVMNDKPE